MVHTAEQRESAQAAMRARLTQPKPPKPRKPPSIRRAPVVRAPYRPPIPAPLCIANSTATCAVCDGTGLCANGVSPCACALQRISRRAAGRYRYLEEYAGLTRGSNNWRVIERRALWLADVAIAARAWPLWRRVRLDGEARTAGEWRATNGVLNSADSQVGRALALRGMWP